eukprot:gene12948-5987_t
MEVCGVAPAIGACDGAGTHSPLKEWTLKSSTHECMRQLAVGILDSLDCRLMANESKQELTLKSVSVDGGEAGTKRHQEPKLQGQEKERKNRPNKRAVEKREAIRPEAKRRRMLTQEPNGSRGTVAPREKGRAQPGTP